MLTIKMTGVEAVVARLDMIQGRRGLQRGIQAAADMVQEKAKVYPPRRRVRRQAVYGKTFESDAQRRKIFAMIGEGVIPYQRGGSGSENLRTSWSVQYAYGGKRAVIGNRAKYADLVVGEHQTRMHAAIGWKKVSQIVRENEGRVRQVVSEAVMRELKGG